MTTIWFFCPNLLLPQGVHINFQTNCNKDKYNVTTNSIIPLINRGSSYDWIAHLNKSLSKDCIWRVGGVNCRFDGCKCSFTGDAKRSQ
jgi:hypothetical protein